MQYAISKQTSTLSIEFAVAEANPLEARKHGILDSEVRSRRTGPRYFDPREGNLKIVDDERRSITLYGPRILKGGRHSDTERLSATWSRRDIEQAPEWVRTIWREAGA